MKSGQRVCAIVVDDSAVFRHLVVRTLEQDSSIAVVASAPNGAVALEKIAKLNPDVVSLDLEMPEMDGLETLRRIRPDFPQIRVVMFSSYIERGASATFEALSLGADDYVTKTGSDDSTVSLRDSLLPKIKQFFLFSGETSDAPFSEKNLQSTPLFKPNKWTGLTERPRVILIGVSTGGPDALVAVLPQIPADFDLPILTVQHMPPLFTRFLGDRLRETSELPVSEAEHGEKLDAPKILVAPGDFHTRVANRRSSLVPEIVLDQDPPENSCRPAVDALFCSAANFYSAATLSIVMTGMGQDGLRVAGALKSRGGFVMVQDESTSAVWGMPRAIFQAKLADAVLPLQCLIPEMLNRLAALSKKSKLEIQLTPPAMVKP